MKSWFCVFALLGSCLAAPIPQLAKLTSTDPNSWIGVTVAVSQDGKTIAAGATQSNAIYVFTKPDNGWADATQTAKLTASDGQQFDQLGTSVSIDWTGDVVIAGIVNTGRPGAVYVWQRPQEGWHDMTETAQLTTSDLQTGDMFGSALFVGGSGQVIVAGAPLAEGVGGAYIFVRNGDTWQSATETATLLPPDNCLNFGSVVIVGWNTAFVNGGCGGLSFYNQPQGGWVTKAADGMIAGGNCLALTSTTLAVGVPTGINLFVKPQGGWQSTNTPSAQIINNSTYSVGLNVAMSGNMVLMGQETMPKGGRADLYVAKGGQWPSNPFGFKGSDTTGQDYFGSSVGLAGRTMVVGAFGANAVYVFGQN